MAQTKIIGKDAYNKFTGFASLSYNCIKLLMDENELVWRLLGYTDEHAWNKPNLTQAEKGALIYAGQQDSSNYRVFMDGKQPDVLMKEVPLLRIMPSFAMGRNRTVGYVEISMEVFSHYKINTLSNYTTRVDLIIEELYGLFNGADVGGIGLLNFDKLSDQSARLFEIGQIPFGGKQIVFSVNMV